MPDISPVEMENARYLYQQHVKQRENVVSPCIIQPLDYQIRNKIPTVGGLSAVSYVGGKGEDWRPRRGAGRVTGVNHNDLSEYTSGIIRMVLLWQEVKQDKHVI